MNVKTKPHFTAAVREVKHLEVAFTSDRGQKMEIDTLIDKALVMREQCRSMITKWVLSNNANLSFIHSFSYPLFLSAELGMLQQKT